jgi:LysR family transcriptional regulator, nitrogen assimilation regulatory protein
VWALGGFYFSLMPAVVRVGDRGNASDRQRHRRGGFDPDRRRLFNAACRVADVEPNILLESRAPHTLLALAEAGQGVAIIPSVLRTDRYRLRIARVTHRRKPLRDRYVIQWDKRRPMPSYAQNFCTALASYMREVLPITRPSSR